jgi:CubicO group peptidase (beta-lactamase class C family)
MADEIETSIQAAINIGKIKGAVICATDAGGDFVYNKALGERTLLSGEKRPQRLDDVLCLASATKLITTIAALQCVEDGLLALTDDLSTIAPELGAKQVLTGFSDDGEKPLVESQARPITLEMLLTHSAGTSYNFIDPQIRRWCEKFAPPRADGRQLVEMLFDYPLGYQPGAGWMYGPGLDWAGRVIERVTSITLIERMQQRIFDPLGITDAQFHPVTREDLRARLVDLTPDDPDGLGRAVLGGKVDIFNHTRGDFGGHGLVMTGVDYAKVLHSLLANDGKLLQPAIVDDMFQHHLSDGGASGRVKKPLRSPLPHGRRCRDEGGTRVGRLVDAARR